MPTYDYRCKECGHQYEAFQSMTADYLTECPVCDGPVERLIGSGAGLVFKGSGFYITDYKNKNKKNEKPKSEKPKSEKPKSESKPADKTTKEQTKSKD